MKMLEKILKVEEVSAHCDIPCGIYDPIVAQLSALSSLRAIELMEETLESNLPTLEKKNKLHRLVIMKEEEAEKAKHEIRVVWGDFIKPEYIKKYPEIHGLVYEIMQCGSKVKQFPNSENGLKFIEKINDFAKIFWEIKGEKTVEKDAPYGPKVKLVYRDYTVD